VNHIALQNVGGLLLTEARRLMAACARGDDAMAQDAVARIVGYSSTASAISMGNQIEALHWALAQGEGKERAS